MKLLRQAIFGSLVILCLYSSGTEAARADTTIDHTTELAVTEGLGANGRTHAGETFTVGPDQYLQDFGFVLDNFYAPVTFNLTISSWDGTSAGPALFESAPVRAADRSSQAIYYSFATDNLFLSPRQQYAAHITQINDASMPNPNAILEMGVSYLHDTFTSPPTIYGALCAGGSYISYSDGFWFPLSDPSGVVA